MSIETVKRECAHCGGLVEFELNKQYAYILNKVLDVVIYDKIGNLEHLAGQIAKDVTKFDETARVIERSAVIIANQLVPKVRAAVGGAVRRNKH